MDSGAPLTPNNMLATLSDNNMDFDLMDTLFDDGCWLAASPSNFWPQGLSPVASDFSSYYFSTTDADNINHLEPNSLQEDFQEEEERLNYSENVRLVWETSASLAPESSLVDGNRMNTSLWIPPSEDPNSTTSVKNKLFQAFEHLKHHTRDDFLIQIWVPVKKEGQNVLSTNNQPFSLDPKSKSLEWYRNVSSNYQFAAQEDSKEYFGLPGRVFLKKLPEWTADVRRLRREDFPRIDYAQQCNVRGSIALPVFERGSGACLGVVEIVTTGPDCRPELDDVCKALEDREEVAEIKEILTSVCKRQNLPLAQTWVPCTQQSTEQCRSNGDMACLSVDASACYYVQDEQVLSFHEACCKKHLLSNEGVVGRALMTNHPCFTTEISAFNEIEYPLAYHAKMARLHGAVAIRFRSIYTDSISFIIEFFLPIDCKDLEEQKQSVSLLSSQIRQLCHGSHFLPDVEIETENLSPVRENSPPGGRLVEEIHTKFVSSSSSEEATRDELSWISQMLEAQQKGNGISVSLGNQKQEPEDFNMNTDWIIPDGRFFSSGAEPSLHKNIVQDKSRGTAKNGVELSSVKGQRSSGAKKAGEHRKLKAERTISLQVLRQYFAGSLKDAAASIGVCPTTLKRICRQHGISRWPSRKIKKVGHSLKKLQLVIDSVQGSEGAIQLSSFYTNFPELSSQNVTGTSSLSPSKIDNQLKPQPTQHRESLLSPATTASQSTSSSSPSSSSSYCCSTEAKEAKVNANFSGTGDAPPAVGVLKRALSDAKLHDSVQEDTKFLVRSHSYKLFSELPPLGSLIPPQKGNNNQALKNGTSFRVKATLGEEKIRFSMPQYWGFTDLQREISRRFNIDIEDVNKLDLRYLDEDSEWILLTCNDDLVECIDIHRSSKSHTIKLSLRHSRYPNLGSSLDSCGPS
uniref:RWP-RK domain-containing protein n=1 Tax=Daucus carota subsp. sativus TaxID=79200 RepID=A0A165A654_DAUCS